MAENELDLAVREALKSDPALAEEAKELLRLMMASAREVLLYGTKQAKAALISKGLATIITQSSLASQRDENADLRDQLSELREEVFRTVPRAGTTTGIPQPSPLSPTDAPPPPRPNPRQTL